MREVKTITQIQSALRAGSTSVVDIVDQYLENIEASKDYNIYVEVFGEEAREQAINLDQRIKDGSPLGELYGVIISIKDVLCYKDHKVSAASDILESFTSQYTATAIQRLLDEDVIIIGRTNCDEFAMGSTNEHSRYGATLNGLDKERVPGGSSGAAAVSVERDTCLIGIGSDTGGSVRQPAAFCGIVGMKPTYGRISRYGLIAYGSSFDQMGILAKNVEDVGKVLKVMSGHDPMDATSIQENYPKKDPIYSDQKYKIAYIPEVLDHKGLNSEIQKGCKDFLNTLRESGHTCDAVSFDLLPYLVPAYYVLTTAEASSNLSRFDGIRYGHRTKDFSNLEELYARSRTEGFGLEVKRRIMMGTFVLSVGYFDAYFTKAQQVRTLIIERLKEIYSEYDFIVMPTTTDIAWKRGKMTEDPVSMYLSDIYTVLANLAGCPAISIPRSSDQLILPYGLQIMSFKYQEHKLLSFCMSL